MNAMLNKTFKSEKDRERYLKNYRSLEITLTAEELDTEYVHIVDNEKEKKFYIIHAVGEDHQYSVIKATPDEFNLIKNILLTAKVIETVEWAGDCYFVDKAFNTEEEAKEAIHSDAKEDRIGIDGKISHDWI